VAAWRRGERPLAEEFLARDPELGDEAAIRLIYEEFCLRQEAGIETDPAEFARRFPKWRAELELLLDCHRMMGPSPALEALPSVGEILAGFRLHAELGRGVSGRVFLATQPELANRPVVLKVTPRGREEHLSLAQLQHMNIVPLHSAQVLFDRNLQVLCMPFLGAASLAQILELLKSVPPARRTGQQLINALDKIQDRLPISAPAQGPFRQYLARSSYVDVVCWIGACLADGLQYAHERNVMHLDIKPSNVLLAAAGQPMLLDFHVARGPIVAGEPRPAWMGGTLDYMPPEQRGAIDSVLEGRSVPEPVDGRADIYSLALLLYEALGGRARPAGKVPLPALHRLNPHVSVGLSDIIHKCLQPDPHDRYPDAEALAADLRRHLSDLPLRGVNNRSLAERWCKWRRRRPASLPRSLVLLGLVAMVSAALGLFSVAHGQREHEIRGALASGQASLGRHQYAEATDAFRRGLALTENFPAVEQYKPALSAALAQAQRDSRAAELHRITELLRFRYGIDPPPPEEAQALVSRGRAIWQASGSLMQPISGRSETNIERGIRADLLDFVLAWADLRVRSAPPTELDEARHEAVRVLDEANALLGPSPAIDRDRLAYAGQTGSSLAPTLAPRSAWEHYNLGRSYLRSGQIPRAAEQFQLGLEMRPQDFWLNFYQGLCAFRLGRFEDAVSAFRVCIALSPESAECSYNRALAYGALGQTQEAIRDYTRALELNPNLTEAALNRGILYYRDGQFADAVNDLQRALGTASDRVVRGTIHYNLSLVYRARGDRPAADSSLRAAVDLGNTDARELYKRVKP
jgi:eukaryotic-like serine/threonine-protein kinase